MQTLTARQLYKPIDEIMAYQNPAIVEHYLKKYGGSKADATRCFATLKQFLAVCSISDGDRVASKSVDNMWHTFILFTKDYKVFCESYLGRFIHHVPSSDSRSASLSVTRSLAEKLFGPIDEELWPVKAVVECDCCPAV